VERILRSQHPATVRELARLAAAESNLVEDDLVAVIKEMARDGSLVLNRPKHETASFLRYLLTPIVSLWFWSSLGLTVLAMIVIILGPGYFPIVQTRWVLGYVLTLFMPGYALLQLLFPRGSEISSLQRFVLSATLSLAIVALVGLALQITSFEVRMVPLTLSVSVATILFLSAAATRKYLDIRTREGVTRAES
jgi:hypothetical protein